MSLRRILQAKIHRLTISAAEPDYEGSMVLPGDLVKAAGFLAGEAVSIWDVTNGERLETYVIVGERGSGFVSINGAAALKIKLGDIVIVASFALMSEAEARAHLPKVVFVDGKNQVTEIRAERI
jgi:aspartate 1-decarboxylase